MAKAAAPSAGGFSEAASSPVAEKPEANLTIANRQVIRKGMMAVRVSSVKEAEKQIRRIVKDSGGFTSGSQGLASEEGLPTLSITLRLPVARFDIAYAQIGELGFVKSESTTSDDVTEQIVDAEARIKTMKAEEESYREMLKLSRKLSDTIELKSKISQIRQTIESLDAQRKSLSTQAAYSTLDVTLSQELATGGKPKDPNWFSQVTSESSNAMGMVGRGLATILIWIATFLPLWLLPLLGWLVYNRAKSKKNVPPPPPIS